MKTKLLSLLAIVLLAGPVGAGLSSPFLPQAASRTPADMINIRNFIGLWLGCKIEGSC